MTHSQYDEINDKEFISNILLECKSYLETFQNNTLK